MPPVLPLEVIDGLITTVASGELCVCPSHAFPQSWPRMKDLNLLKQDRGRMVSIPLLVGQMVCDHNSDYVFLEPCMHEKMK